MQAADKPEIHSCKNQNKQPSYGAICVRQIRQRSTCVEHEALMKKGKFVETKRQLMHKSPVKHDRDDVQVRACFSFHKKY